MTKKMVPAQLKAIREQLNLNQAEFAEALGVRMNTVSRWELGQLPISQTVSLAAEHLLCKKRKASKRR